MKKRIAVLVCVLLCAICAAALADVEVNETNFPDKAFRTHVRQFDTDHDGILSNAELKDVEEISVKNGGITSLKGIEYFTELEELDCSINSLTELDVSKNKKLEELWCSENALTTLNLTKNTQLEKLGCASNQLQKLNVSKNKKLEELYCDLNHFTLLDVSNCPTLVKLVKKAKRVNTGEGYDYWNDASSWLYVSSDVTVKAGSKVSKPVPVTVRFTIDNLIYEVSGKNVSVVQCENRSAKNVTIPATVTYENEKYTVTAIGPFVFKDMEDLKTVKLGSSLKNIGNEAFAQCENLKTVSGGKSLVNIGSGAFMHCESLTAFTFGENISKIGTKAFYDCKKLAKITFETKKLKKSGIGSYSFGNICKTVVVKLPKDKFKSYRSWLKKAGKMPATAKYEVLP